jgi:hypothetical protein
MSWRDAARRYFPEDAPVPNVPIRPKAGEYRLIGTVGTFGTGAEVENGCEQHDAHVSDWVAWNERAAIMEYDGGLTRTEAEADHIVHLRKLQ